jgi:sulfate adenylyltransferase subunit 2
MEVLSPLDALEAESIHILREAAAQFRRPVLLYSIGKDSTVLLHLARKAGQAAVPAPARRHDLEVPRHDRLPRSHRA